VEFFHCLNQLVLLGYDVIIWINLWLNIPKILHQHYVIKARIYSFSKKRMTTPAPALVLDHEEQDHFDDNGLPIDPRSGDVKGNGHNFPSVLPALDSYEEKEDDDFTFEELFGEYVSRARYDEVKKYLEHLDSQDSLESSGRGKAMLLVKRTDRSMSLWNTPPLSLVMRYPMPWKGKSCVKVPLHAPKERALRKDLIRLLLDYGADPNAVDGYQFTALDIAHDTHVLFSAPIAGLAEDLLELAPSAKSTRAACMFLRPRFDKQVFH
jgi:hypothetical protein